MDSDKIYNEQKCNTTSLSWQEDSTDILTELCHEKKTSNRDIANIFREIALYLEAENIAFKPQAYQTASEHILGLTEELTDLYASCGTQCIDEIPGIGKELTKKIEELITTGKLGYYQKIKKQYPFDMLGITRIQDVGPKTAMMLFKKLKVKSVKDIERAAKKSLIASLPGMGKRTEDKIIRGIAYLKGQVDRRVIHDVLPFAQTLVEKLSNISGTTHVDIAGSLRRRKDTIGDIDLLATSKNPALLIRAFTSLQEVDEVLEKGTSKVTVRYLNGMQGDLFILSPSQYGSALVHFTGSREHNILLRKRAKQKNLTLSEHGLFKQKKPLSSKTEKNIYTHLGLQYIPPELRLGTDEIDQASKKKLPSLVPYGSLKGDLQTQTTWSDGNGTIEEMAREAKRLGLSYMAVTDHTKTLKIAHGLTESEVKKQGREIDQLNKKMKGIRILKSIECDILKDGSLDLSDDCLKTLDVVSVSVHSHRNMNKKEMTERLIRGIKHPLVNILFHPTGRVVGKRPGYDLDISRVIKAAKEYHVALEVNGSERLDLPHHYILQAVEAGVKLVISTDAHDPSHMEHLEYGIAQARKGWAKKSDVLNTKPLKSFLAALKKK